MKSVNHIDEFFELLYYCLKGGDAPMDDTDRAILRALTANGRATASEIGREVNLSVPAAAARIRKLEEAGVILKYTVG